MILYDKRCSPHKYDLYLSRTLFKNICISQFLYEEFHFSECLELDTAMPHNDLKNGRGRIDDVTSWRECGK